MPDRGGGRRADRGRQRGGKDKTGRVGTDGVDNIGACGDIAAEAAERLGKRAFQNIDAVRSYAPGFIFTTALPPAICSAATAAIRHLKTSNWERERHQDRAARVKAILNAAGLPVMSNDTHIVPLFVGCPDNVKRASDMLLDEHNIYIQPINYPTVAKGTERLRITPSPYHDDGLIDQLAEALLQVWERLDLPLRKKSLAAE